MGTRTLIVSFCDWCGKVAAPIEQLTKVEVKACDHDVNMVPDNEICKSCAFELKDFASSRPARK
jgi:hypothetical protein